MQSSAPLVEIDAQYRVAREECGLHDAGTTALLVVWGADAAEHLQGQLTQEIEGIDPGAGAYAALLNRKGRMQADARVLRLDDQTLWLLSEPEGLDALRDHLRTYAIGREVTIEPVDPAPALLRLLGPASERALDGPPLRAEHDHAEVALGGARCRAIATPQGIDLVVEADTREEAIRALDDRGAAPIGAEAVEIIRVEAGRPRFGVDMGTETIPQEAGVNERAVNFEKGCYIGQETVARLHYKGKPNRHLRGLELSEPVTAGEPVRLGERELGTVGTAVVSPARGPIALAILRREAEPGTEVEVGSAPGRVVEVPFR